MDWRVIDAFSVDVYVVVGVERKTFIMKEESVMPQQWIQLNRLGTIGLLIIGIVILVTTAAARELSPNTVEMLAPISDTDAGEEVGAPESTGVRIIRRLPVKAQVRQTPAAQPAQALSEPAEFEPLASVPTSFVGLNQVNAGGFIPPDTIVGKSNTRVLEAVNVSLRLFTTTGGVLATKTLNNFFGTSTSQGILFDPKVYFDRNATNRRFYVVALQQTGTNDATGSPESGWGSPEIQTPATWNPLIGAATLLTASETPAPHCRAGRIIPAWAWGRISSSLALISSPSQMIHSPLPSCGCSTSSLPRTIRRLARRSHSLPSSP